MPMVSDVIYIVDDDEAVLRALSFLCRASGFVVHPFASGVAFLAACDCASKGCAVLDIELVETNAFAIVKALRARGAALAVVLMTGRPSPGVMAEADALGLPLLMKPPTPGAFIDAVRAALAR